ncbi:MAG: DMT family transporter [Anaerolineales bacterium]|nr:MAG: DMT family transporter [Anaerolineales bacterium]
MFSTFWALQIFTAKLGFNAGAVVLPFQLMLVLSAMLTLAILLLPRSGAELGSLFKRQPGIFWQLFLANGIQAGVGTGLSIIGIALTEAINAGFLVKLASVSTILFAWLLLKERLTGLKMAVAFTMLLGMYLLTTKGERLLPQTGDLLILGACVCWSLGNVLVRRILKTQAVSADAVTMQKPVSSLPVYAILVGLSIAYPGKLGSLQPVLQCCTFSPTSLPYALASGICLALAWIYLYRTLRLASASYMTLMSMVTPILVSVLALVFLGERLVWIQVGGAGLILLSGVLVYLSDVVNG